MVDAKRINRGTIVVGTPNKRLNELAMFVLAFDSAQRRDSAMCEKCGLALVYLTRMENAFLICKLHRQSRMTDRINSDSLIVSLPGEREVAG